MTRTRIVTERFVGWIDGALTPEDVLAILVWIHASGWTVRYRDTWQGVASMMIERDGRPRRRRPFPSPSRDTLDAEWLQVQRALVRA